MNPQEEKLLRKLEERRQKLQSDAFETPLGDYTKYRESVAKHAVLGEVIQEARQIFAGAEDDDEGAHR